MLKIRDGIDLKELEKFGYIKYQNEEALVDYYKFEHDIAKQIHKDRTLHIQLPKRLEPIMQYVNDEKYFDDLIKADLVEKVEE